MLVARDDDRMSCEGAKDPLSSGLRGRARAYRAPHLGYVSRVCEAHDSNAVNLEQHEARPQRPEHICLGPGRNAPDDQRSHGFAYRT